MITTIQKWGNSFAVRLPKKTIEKLHLHEGQTVQIEAADDGKSFSLVPTTTRSRSLKEIVATITPETLHGEVDWGPAVGKEIW